MNGIIFPFSYNFVIENYFTIHISFITNCIKVDAKAN